MPRWLLNLLTAVLVVGIPPLLVLSNLALFLTPQYLAFEYGKPDFAKADRFSDQDRLYYSSETVEYEAGHRNFEQFKNLGVYNDRELNHMVDVRVLISQVTMFAQMDAVLLLVVLVTLSAQPVTRSFAARGILGGATLTVALFAAIGLFAGTAFNTFFVNFHHVFFQGETWLFNYSDSLIQFYPERFWFDTSLYLAGITILEALVVGAVGWIWLRSTALARGKDQLSVTSDQ